MPFNNRYVVAALDTDGEQIAYLSPSHSWITSVREAVCFPSHIDARYFMAANNLDETCQSLGSISSNSEHSQQPLSKPIDRVQAVFVTVKNTDDSTASHKNKEPEEAMFLTGIFG